MKIIDLLVKIANGEIPKKIKYNGTIYEYDNYKGDEGYVDKTQEPYKWFEKEIDCDVKQYLNEEVEIIEKEKKIPEKLEIIEDGGDTGINDEYMPYKQFRVVSKKINEIIDYLKSKGE